ncbi:MAG: hypothetical protein ACE5OZ_03745 [Candidatus Heimdallarchaeota archaeon]
MTIDLEPIKRAKSLASNGQTSEALNVLQENLAKLQETGESDVDATQMFEVEKAKGLLELAAGDILKDNENHREAVTHYLLSAQALRSAQSMGDMYPQPLSDCLNGASECFAAMGSEFERDKYAREADDVKSAILREQIASLLGEQGFNFKQEVKLPNVAQTVDFVAEKGFFIWKKRIYVWFAFDETECQHLSLSSRDISGDKYFLLVRGNPGMVMPRYGERIIQAPDEIEV